LTAHEDVAEAVAVEVAEGLAIAREGIVDLPLPKRNLLTEGRSLKDSETDA
jgi:hypothetical protein